MFQSGFGLVDRGNLDDKLIAVKEGVEHFGVQNRCFGYSKVQRVLSANRHRQLAGDISDFSQAQRFAGELSYPLVV